MMNDNGKYIDDRSVRREMEKQWDDVPAVSVDLLGEKARMWQNISSRTRRGGKVMWLWRYSVAASILLVAALGALFFMPGKVKDSYIYVVYTGNQDNDVLTLSDGTQVKLGAGSKLTYPSEFPSGERRIELEGQAFFDVAADPERPFCVHTGDVAVTALGTSFEIFEDRNNRMVETILLSGSVKVEKMDAGPGAARSAVLRPDQKLTVSLNSGEMNVSAVNADRYSSWRNYNGLSFTEEKLSVIVPRLEYWYGCRIKCNSPDILDERFSFKVKNESLDRILKLAQLSASIGFCKNEDDSVYTLYRIK